MERTCKVCNKKMNKEFFRKGYNKNKQGDCIPTYRNTCIPCEKEITRQHIFYKTRGITIEERDRILEEQGSVCAACGSDKPNSIKGWHVDHCHTTGVIRGVLCANCNVALGQVKDSVGTLQALIDYLIEHGKERATTIPKGSTLQAIGSGNGEPLTQG